MTILSRFRKNLTDVEKEQYLQAIEDWNNEHGITGCSVIHLDEMIELLEGRKKVLTEYFEASSGHTTRRNCGLIWEGSTNSRIFRKWNTVFNYKVTSSIDSRSHIANMLFLSNFMERSTACVAMFWNLVGKVFSVGLKSSMSNVVLQS